jgi:hypothetical protein
MRAARFSQFERLKWLTPFEPTLSSPGMQLCAWASQLAAESGMNLPRRRPFVKRQNLAISPSKIA